MDSLSAYSDGHIKRSITLINNDVALDQPKRTYWAQLDGIKGIICFFIIFIHYNNRMPSDVFPITWIPDMLLSCTTFLFPTAMLCLLNIPWIAWTFSRRPLVWLGKISMSTFLVHVPVMNLINTFCYKSGALPFDQASSFVVVMLIIFAVSAMWYCLIENKIIPGFLKAFERR